MFLFLNTATENFLIVEPQRHMSEEIEPAKEKVLPQDIELLKKIGELQSLIVGLIMVSIYVAICSFVTVLINANNTLLALIIAVPYLVFLGWMYFMGTRMKDNSILVSTGISAAGMAVLLLLLVLGYI